MAVVGSIGDLSQRIAARTTPVAILGQGYVGLTLAAAAAEAGFRVSGVDVDAGRVGALRRGELVVSGVDESLFRAGIRSGNLTFTSSGGGGRERPGDPRLCADPAAR